MRAADLDIHELLHFVPEGGLITFAGERVLLLDAVALGLLRKELIETLGATAARAVLTRFGYSLEPPPPFTDSGSTAAVCSFSRSLKARSEARLSEQQHEGRGSGSGRAPERHHHVVTNRVGAERG